MSDMGWKMDDLPAQPTCGYCRDCRWWEVTSTKGVGICCYSERRENTNIRMWPSWQAVVYIKPDFGCVQWEAKDDTR